MKKDYQSQASEYTPRRELIHRIVNEFEKRGILWAVGCSFSLFLRGIVDDFHDFDVLVANEHIEEKKFKNGNEKFLEIKVNGMRMSAPKVYEVPQRLNEIFYTYKNSKDDKVEDQSNKDEKSDYIEIYNQQKICDYIYNRKDENE